MIDTAPIIYGIAAATLGGGWLITLGLAGTLHTSPRRATVALALILSAASTLTVGFFKPGSAGDAIFWSMIVLGNLSYLLIFTKKLERRHFGIMWRAAISGISGKNRAADFAGGQRPLREGD